MTEREKWLMEKAYEFGACHRDIYFNNWLNDMAADAVTVEMVLCKVAPTNEPLAAPKCKASRLHR